MLWTKIYSVLPLEEGNGGGGDGVLGSEEEHPTSSTLQPVTKKRRTATVVEVEKAKLAQANKMNSVPESMERWRCTTPHCHL